MTWYEDVTWCDGCGVEIIWAPVLVERRTYCCRDCSEGFRCVCGERMEFDEEPRGSTPVNTTYML